MAIPEPTGNKQHLRDVMLRLARESYRDSSATCATLDRWLGNHPAVTTLAAYAALPGEVELSATIQLHPERRWVYPKVVGNHLTFHCGDSLEPGKFGILEPAAGCEEIPLEEIDAFLCPGLAFDVRGGRMGRGKGFYDRLLAQARPGVLKIGICHEFQIVQDTFPEPHDVAMDELVF